MKSSRKIYSFIAQLLCSVVWCSNQVKHPFFVTSQILQPVVRINCGGKTITDGLGRTWQGDDYYHNGGSKGEYSIVGALIRNTPHPMLYQSLHWWRRWKPGPFLYEIPVAANGVYDVELHFAELNPMRAKVGLRTFDILVQGVLAFPKMDVFEKTGAAFSALNVTTTTTVLNGKITIEWRKLRFNPIICAIAIYWRGSTPIAVPSTAPILPPVSDSFAPVLINVGGAPHVDIEGREWKGDTFFSGGLIATRQGDLVGTFDDILYQTERYGAFTYEIPMPPGNYELVLHFAEFSSVAIGSRVFDVAVEQNPTFLGVDIMSLVGPMKAMTLETAVAVLDGALSLSFSAVAGNSQLSAIEINMVGDHLAHAVANGPYVVVDVDGDGVAYVAVDSTPSHTHGPGRTIVEWLWYEGSKLIGTGEKTTLKLAVGEHFVTLRVKDDGNNKSSETTTVTVRPKGFPAIESLTPTSGFVSGGNPITIHGYGFNYTAEQITVRIGRSSLTGPSQISIVNERTIEVLSAPPSFSGIPASVTVTTPIGVSNAAVYQYVTGAPISWTRGDLYDIASPSTLTFGPDGKLYVGTTDGTIVKLTVSENNAVVQEVVSKVIGAGRIILGMTFDPMSAGLVNPPVYVSHSKPFHGEWKSSSGEAINGKVSIVSGANLEIVRDIITGLPVSDHDHAVNGLEFGDTGELLILVGGNTNGGIPGALSGSMLQKDNVLSSAVLVAYLSDPSFNGQLTYDSPDNGSLNGGYGVEVFAAGLRNPFDIVLHSNLNLYVTDNGPNLKYGDMSKSCVQGIPDIEEEDKLILLARGGYYGHANRKRGALDPRQCVWRSSNEPSDMSYTAPIAILPSSSDGIIEFASDHFGRQMRGNLLVSKYKGGLYRVILAEDGKSVMDAPFLLDDDGDLAITQGPDGSIYSAKYKAGKIKYMVPLEPQSITLVIKSVFPRRGSTKGGSVLSIFGQRFDSSGTPSVVVGGGACPVRSFSASKITCTLPPGSGTVDIGVTTGIESAKFLAGYRYITGMPASDLVARVNIGGPQYIDQLGNAWEADGKNAYYSKGGSTGAQAATTAAISGTANVPLYQTYRVFTQVAPYLYVIPVPSPGRYKVNLYFCEIDPSRATGGMRIMDILLEGKLIRQGFDISVAAGGAFIATVVTATVAVVDGSMTVELKAVKHNPTISAMSVFKVGM